jgi:hypothetical protein
VRRDDNDSLIVKVSDRDTLIVKVSDRDKDEPLCIVRNLYHDRVELWQGTDLLEAFTVGQWRQFVSGTLS